MLRDQNRFALFQLRTLVILCINVYRVYASMDSRQRLVYNNYNAEFVHLLLFKTRVSDKFECTYKINVVTSKLFLFYAITTPSLSYPYPAFQDISTSVIIIDHQNQKSRYLGYLLKVSVVKV